jgi:hypothetical protein
VHSSLVAELGTIATYVLSPRTTADVGQPETLTVFSQHRHNLRNRPSSVKFAVGDAIVPRPTVMLQRSGFSRRAMCGRPATRIIRPRVLLWSASVASPLATVDPEG